MTVDELNALVRSEQKSLAALLCRACGKALDELREGNRYAFDAGEGLREVCGKVGEGEYIRDRPSSGVLSALYEGPGKWSAAMEAMLGQVERFEGAHLKVLDLGFGGAGPAVAAALMATHWPALSSVPCPVIQVHVVDASPFVLEFFERHLWPAVVTQYPGAEHVEISFDHNTCLLEAERDEQDVWVFAGYVFDHVNHRKGFIEGFCEAMELRKPEKAWIVGPSRSLDAVPGLREELHGSEYQTALLDMTALHGPVEGALDLHRELVNEAFGEVRHLHAPSWHNPELFCVMCSFEGARQLVLGGTDVAPWDMYTPKLRDRSKVKLNQRQEGAATWTGKVRPTCISGTAGSGKSLVLTERLANLVKKPPREMGMAPYDPDFRILFTTFNKELSAELKNWIGDVLGDKAEWTGGGFTFVGSQFQNIRLLHFDVIPTRIGRYSHVGSRLLGGSAAVSINGVMERVRKELELRPGEHADILDPDYIEEEFDRVFYGMELTSLREYQTVARKGRGQKGGGPEQRRIVGKVMEEWMRHCHEGRTYTFHMVRRMFLNDLKKERHRPMFTDIFVDEFQDCTPADFSIFYRLLKDSNRLIVAGDLAQSVHLGTTADMPRDRLDQGEDQRNFRRIFLEGSYRLPLHISLCVQGLSKAIQSRQKESGMMSPYEGAPPGVRLLFVSARGAEEMASKLSAIMETYAPYRRRLQGEGADERAVIMESDKELARALSKLRPNSVMSDTILRLKGLEKSMVIWSTRALYQSEDDSLEFVYTILTRSSGLAVIAYFEGETPDSYRTVMNTLNKELLLSWDKGSQDALDALQTDKLEDNELVF